MKKKWRRGGAPSRMNGGGRRNPSAMFFRQIFGPTCAPQSGVCEMGIKLILVRSVLIFMNPYNIDSMCCTGYWAAICNWREMNQKAKE